MINKRCKNTLHKKYRRYRSDIWGKLALKQRNNFITNLIYDFAQMALRRRLRKVTFKARRRVRKVFGKTLKRISFKNFNYDITVKAKQQRFRPSSRRGNLLKMRRQISLYYGGGRIRAKTFRRYSRLIVEKANRKTIYIDKTPYHEYANPTTYASLVESRLDVLLLRCNFVDSIYRARTFVFHRKCKVQGLTRVSHPAMLIKNYQRFMLKGNYAKNIRHNLVKRMKSKRTFINTPSYIFVNYALMIAFKIENPITRLVSFPFAEQPGALANFRKSFRML